MGGSGSVTITNISRRAGLQSATGFSGADIDVRRFSDSFSSTRSHIFKHGCKIRRIRCSLRNSSNFGGSSEGSNELRILLERWKWNDRFATTFDVGRAVRKVSCRGFGTTVMFVFSPSPCRLWIFVGLNLIVVVVRWTRYCSPCPSSSSN